MFEKDCTKKNDRYTTKNEASYKLNFGIGIVNKSLLSINIYHDNWSVINNKNDKSIL